MKPTALIMQTEPKYLDADELEAGVGHCERMIARFEARLAGFQREQANRGINRGDAMSAEDLYVDYDEDTGMWCVFDANSNFAYSSWASEAQAEEDCARRKTQVAPFEA